MSTALAKRKSNPPARRRKGRRRRKNPGAIGTFAAVAGAGFLGAWAGYIGASTVGAKPEHLSWWTSAVSIGAAAGTAALLK